MTGQISENRVAAALSLAAGETAGQAGARRVRVAVAHCGCAADAPDDPDAYCEACLPGVAAVPVGVDANEDMRSVRITFRFRRLLREGERRLAEYTWEGA